MKKNPNTSQNSSFKRGKGKQRGGPSPENDKSRGELSVTFDQSVIQKENERTQSVIGSVLPDLKDGEYQEAGEGEEGFIDPNLPIEEQNRLKKLQMMYYGKKFQKEREQKLGVKNSDPNQEAAEKKRENTQETDGFTKSSESSKAFSKNNLIFKENHEYQVTKKAKEFMRLSYLQKLVISDLIGTFFGITGLLLEMISSQKFYTDNKIELGTTEAGGKIQVLDPSTDGSSFSFFQSSSTFCSLVCIICTVYSYRCEYFSMIQRNMIKNTTTMVDLGWHKTLIAECLILMVHNPSFINNSVVVLINQGEKIEVGMNQMVTIFMFTRLYLLVKLFGRFSKYQSVQVIRLCYNYYVDATIGFSIRAFLKNNPYALALMCLIVVIGVCGYGIQTFEAPATFGLVYELEPNSYWNVIITLSTVGYGDIFPKTHYGRMFSTLAMFCGQFTNSLIIMAMTITAQFSLEEAKAFKDYKVVEYFQERYQLGVKITAVRALEKMCLREYEKEKNAGAEVEPEENTVARSKTAREASQGDTGKGSKRVAPPKEVSRRNSAKQKSNIVAPAKSKTIDSADIGDGEEEQGVELEQVEVGENTNQGQNQYEPEQTNYQGSGLPLKGKSKKRPIDIRFGKIGFLSASRMLKIKLKQMVQQYKEMNASFTANETQEDINTIVSNLELRLKEQNANFEKLYANYDGAILTLAQNLSVNSLSYPENHPNQRIEDATTSRQHQADQ